MNDKVTDGEAVFEEEELIFLPVREVVRRTSLSDSTIRRMVADGEFPRPVQVGRNRSAWVEAEVVEWQMQVLAGRAA